MKRITLFILLTVASIAAWAEPAGVPAGADSARVRFLYDVELMVRFDNHESHSALEPSSTLFGTRLTPTIGVGYTDSVVGSHRLMAGVSYIQPFGSTWRQAKVQPTVYYQYAQRGFRANFGFVPYSTLYDELPDYLMSDSMRFVYPNIQGILLQYGDARGHVELFCDWRGLMSDTVREAFRIVANGRGYAYKTDNHAVYLGGNGMLNHLSHSERVPGVCDDMTLNPLVGYTYDSRRNRIHSWKARIEAGYLLSWQRDRVAGISSISNGFRMDGELRWWFIGLREQIYAGGNAMALYPKYGRLLNQGDAKYQAPFYSRTDIYLTLAEWQFMTIYAGWNIIWTKGEPLSQQQQITCCFRLGELMNYVSKRR